MRAFLLSTAAVVLLSTSLSASQTKDKADHEAKHETAKSMEHDDDDHDDHGKREVEGHEHGHAELSGVLRSGGGLLELHVPANSIVGFESAPETATQKAMVSAAITSLKTIFGEALDCDVAAQDAELEVEGEHAEFHVEVEYSCASLPDSLNLSALFKAFPKIEEVDGEFIVEGKAMAGEIEPDAASFSLK